MQLNINNVSFIKSAATARDILGGGLPEICFAGKSNVGKSSVINSLVRRKNMARVGEKPGKTVHINYFDVDGRLRFADLPGYGYAKIAKSEKDRWAKLCEDYFARAEFVLGVFIVDIRHKPTADDIMMANWFSGTGTPCVVVANKLDKIKKSELEGNLALIEETLAIPDAHIIPYSATAGQGRDALFAEITKERKTD
ncbi:MAG: ribosome biogenesis GTP-binding protein YihA/YsxC [Oscillospiraceae bacterium]|jgi:GTP-binding protein|nr:ribosome biogenesis GTP-binding protein YihA/YsxC [Oscillospiraceae bacterium]